MAPANSKAIAAKGEGAELASTASRACITSVTHSAESATDLPIEVTYFDAPVERRRVTPEPWRGEWRALADYLESKFTNARSKGASGYFVAAECRGFHSDANCSPTRVVALDFDDPGPRSGADWAPLDAFTYVAHTSDSHTDDEPRWRVWCLLDRAYTAEEIRRARCPIPGAKLRSISQPAFVPTTGDDTYLDVHDGAPLALSTWFAPEAPALAVAVAPTTPSTERREPTTASVAALVQRWFGNPDGTNRLAGTLGSVLADGGYHDDAIAAFMARHLEADQRLSKHLADALRGAAKRRAGDRIMGYDTLRNEFGIEWAWELDAPAADTDALWSALEADPALAETLMSPKAARAARRARLQADYPALVFTQQGTVAANAENVRLWLAKHYPAPRFRLNLLTNGVELDGEAWDAETGPTRLRTEFNRALHSDPGVSTFASAVAVAAADGAYSPVVETLEALPSWDGTPRVATWLEHYLGATVPDGAPDYLGAVGTAWFVAAVARAYEPGCQVDSMLVLEGRQGSGKSTALKLLGRGFWAQLKFKLRYADKDSWQDLFGLWLVEYAELEGMQHADVEALKHHISCPVDHGRRTYDRAVTGHPRRCVFAGTANIGEGDTYLLDEENRRFWPVATNIGVERGDLSRITELERDVGQLWAEALHLYRTGHPWHLADHALVRQARVVQGHRRVRDSLEEILPEVIRGRDYVAKTELLNTREVDRALGGTGDMVRGKRLTKAMRVLGFVAKRSNSVVWFVRDLPTALAAWADRDDATSKGGASWAN